MSDRTTVNLSKEAHSDASSVKDEYNESWSDVAKFYAKHRAEVSLNETDMSDVLGRIDDLESNLPAKIRRELE